MAEKIRSYKMTETEQFNAWILPLFNGEFPNDEIYDTALEAWQASTLAERERCAEIATNINKYMQFQTIEDYKLANEIARLIKGE
jgi:hypothetical protein